MTRSGETLIFENIWNAFFGFIFKFQLLLSSTTATTFQLLFSKSLLSSLLFILFHSGLSFTLTAFGQENLGKNSPFKVILNWIQNQADAYLSLEILMTSVLTTIYLQFSKSYKTIPVGAIHKVSMLKISKVKNPPPTPYSIHLNAFDIILAFHLVHA